MPTSKKPSKKMPLRDRFRRFLGGSPDEPDEPDSPASRTPRQPEHTSRNAEPDSQPLNTPRVLELKGLWKEAYEDLRKDDSELVDAYEFALSRECDSQAAEEADADPEGGMRGFVKHRLQEIQDSHLKVTVAGKSIGIKDQARRAVHAILSVKDFISSAVSTEPHAALAWAGVLVLLHPILKSFTQEEDSIDGFERISGLLVRYRVIECTHIEVPTNRTGSSSDKPVEDLEASIRSETVKLYSMILRYQMRLLKHFSRSGFFRFMEDLRVTDDWREMLQMIVAVEESINENLGALRGHILRQIETGVAQLKDQLKLAQDTMVEARDEAKTAKQDNLLNSLPFAGGAAFNSWEDQHKARCLEGTQNSTLAQIQSWKESPDRETIYWLKGMAGTGKSTISRTLATACYDQTPLFQGASQKSVSNAVLGASFFFDRTKPDRNNASKLVTTICRQIAITIPEIKADICSSISKYPSVGTQSLNNQWEYLVLAPLRLFEKRMLVPLTLITVIDALDECEGEADLAAFLQLIAQAPPLTSIDLKFFITSRPEAHVRSDFRVMAGVSIFEAELHKVALLPETLTADYKDDITRYLDHEITKLTPTKSIDDWPGKNRINELARKSDGLFIYAATACLFLSGAKGHEDRLDMRLNMIFDDRVADGSPQKSLDGIYTRILRYSVIGGAIDEEKELICRRFRLIVGSIVILFEPLTTAALGYLLGQPVSQVKDTLGELYSVLAMGDEQLPIQLLHLSFRDFLLNPARCIDQGFLVSEKETHTALFRHCLGVLKVVLRKNICNLPSFGVCAADITPITLHQHLPEGAQYACRYWPAHLQRAGLEPADEDEVYSFLKTHLLHWLEALSLMHKFSDGIVAVLKLSDYISALPGPPRIALVGILHVAKRFMRRFNLVIEAAPLQVYSSALIHSPERSVIRQHFQGEIPKWIKRAPEVKAEWDPLLQTLHDTLRPEDIALSPDGTRVASSNLRIWDTETGTLLWDFDPLGAGYRVAFSPDGQFVMSISVPGHVRVWNLASGLLIQEVASSLEKSPLPPLHLFSADRTIAVIASYTLKFEVIDIRNGTSLRIIEGPEDALLHMALSNDGVLLASGSTDGCVRLWDVRTGILQHEFAGYLDAIGRVVFSPDDKLLASVSNDKTVKVWDLREGEQLAELSGEFLDLAFLDSAILMCSQPDHSNIQVWDVISNKQETLHGPCCKGLRLSPDGTLLTSVQFRRVEASTLQGPTVAIWSLETGKLVHRLEGHSDCISNAIFSADNKLLASASHDGTIRLWDLSAQASPERLDGHTESVCSIIVSPDLRVAASRAGHDRIRLWDVETGFLRQKFDGNFMADPFFSPDGKLFYVPLGKEVQVWSIATGELTRCINCYSTQVSCSAFSPDGSLLALKYANTNLCLPKDRTLGDTVDAGNDPGVDTDELRLFGCGEPHFISSTIMPPEVGIWNSATGSLLQVAKGASEDHGCLAFSPNGRFLAFGPHHTSVKRILSGGWIAIWDVPNGELSVLGDFVKDVAAISWCSDGNALASIILDDTWERQIQIWDMTTRSLNTSIKTKTWPHLTAFSPDGQLLLSASHDGTYQLWEARTGTMIGQRESLWGAQRLKFSEDANMIDTGLNRLELASFYPGWVPTDSTEFFLTGNWVRQGQLALLLPNDDPPTCAATADGVLIMGHESGRVTFLLLGEE